MSATVEAPRRRQILDAAARLFYRRGYHGVGMGDIGGRLGMSGPALYRHFRAKDEILAALFEEALRGLAIGTEPMEDPYEELAALVYAHADFVLAERELVSIYTHEERALRPEQRRAFRLQASEHAAHWERVLARCHPGLDPRTLAAGVQAAIGALHSVAYWSWEALDAPDLHETLAEAVLRGLLGFGDGQPTGSA